VAVTGFRWRLRLKRRQRHGGAACGSQRKGRGEGGGGGGAHQLAVLAAGCCWLLVVLAVQPFATRQKKARAASVRLAACARAPFRPVGKFLVKTP